MSTPRSTSWGLETEVNPTQATAGDEQEKAA